MFSDELVMGAVLEEGRGVLARHSDYYVWLDLGLRRDPSAVVVLEKLARNTGRRELLAMERHGWGSMMTWCLRWRWGLGVGGRGACGKW